MMQSRMMSLFYTTIISLICLIPQAHAQCLNEVAAYNPNIRTQSANNTWFLVPVAKTAAQNALDASYGKTVTGQSNVQLLNIPSSDRSFFPNGFPSDKHLVLATAGISDDIRMASFQINGALLGGQIIIPFVRRYDSAPGTVLQAQLNGYIAGPDNNQVAGLVPATVATLIEGFATRLGQFSPAAAAYMFNAGIFENKVAWAIAPNPITGPGIYVEALDLQFISRGLQSTTIKLFKYVLNQPAILTGAVSALVGNLCQRNQYYFNNDTSTITTRGGNVTFGAAADGSTPQVTGILQSASPDGSGVYRRNEGFSACGQNVGFNPENCDAAARNVDRTAL